MAKKMKKIDLSCASPASTAICSSLDQRSMIKTSTKSLHRLNSYLGDHYKTLTNNNNNNNSSYYSASPRAPCISELPFTPRPSSFSAYRDKTRKLAPSSSFSYGVDHSDVLMSRRRSSADIADIKRHATTTTTNNNKKNKHIYGGDSSRYLLGESRYLDSLSGNEYTKNTYNNNYNATTTSSSSPVYGCEGAARKSTSGMERRGFGTIMLDAEKEKIRKHFSLIDVGDDQSKHINNKSTTTTTTTTTTCVDGRLSQSQRQRQMQRSVPSPSPSTYANDSLVHIPNKPPSPHQVVVLRVSLHCKGCENKLRKHLSKLPGVASYNIDMETKKVTITGNVTPYEMLTSISKVKNAQFWPSQASSTSTSSSSSSTSSTIDLN